MSDQSPDGHTCWRPGCGHLRRKHDGKCTGFVYDPFGPAMPCACVGFVEPPAPRAAAKPLPDQLRLNVRWEGAPPKLDDYLRSQGHATKLVYRIIEIYKGEAKKYELVVIKLPASSLPAGAVVHTWCPSQKQNKNQCTGTVWGSTD